MADEETRTSMKAQLALAVAQGKSVTGWACANNVCRRTAHRWLKEPKVKDAVESYRRRSVDRAIGRLAKRSTWAVDGITALASKASSESVRLSALRTLLSDMITVTEFGGLEHRMTEVEELVRERISNGARPGWPS